ncbi:signal recognition particle-docking protein FtsY [Hoeflea sp. AS60]|uniref:signal recognition particle-docking protein FtsY n=1 Tax=Hoeflea sp. AS60 TaxID=3135780 RepID=UPI00316BF410
MAFNFIKKVFSFGKDKEDAPQPKTVDQTSPEQAVGAPFAADAATSEQAFPSDGEMQFTPETTVSDELATPAPQDEEHAGEPPIPTGKADANASETATTAPDEVTVEHRNDAIDEGKTPDELTADPSTQVLPEPTAPESETPTGQDGMSLPQDDGAMQFTPETAVSNMPATPAPSTEELSGEPAMSSEAESAEAAEEEQVTPDELTSDPATPPAPEQPAPPAPRKMVVRDTVSEAEPIQNPEPIEEQRGNWWQRLRQGLSRTSGQLTGQISGIFTKRKLDEETLEELEDILLQADLGVETALRITDALSATRYGKDISPAEVQKVMADEITRVLGPVAKPLELDLSHKPHVILVVGVNGTGKTTTIGKLAAKLSSGGLKVTLAAGDTFRAAAIEQLKIWGDRTGSKVVSTKLGADAAGLAYEAFETARADGADVLIIDTAGRLQNRTELMDELAKVVRVIGKLDPDAPHTVLQTLDATTGQNALNQVEIFRNVAGVNGLVMTKLDGTARGGILVAIAAKHKLPVYFVGVGEGVDDLEPFEAADFAAAIAGQPAGDLK